MSELMGVVDSVSLELKVAWAVWLVWGFAQVAAYRLLRVRPSPALSLGARAPVRAASSPRQATRTPVRPSASRVVARDAAPAVEPALAEATAVAASDGAPDAPAASLVHDTSGSIDRAGMAPSLV